MTEREYSERERQATVERLLRPTPTVIGIEGGPCSGKTTLVNAINSAASGRTVVLLPEAATLHIERLTSLGIDIAHMAQYDREAFIRFEADVLTTITDQIQEARELYAGTDALIIADRCDIGAYVSKQEYGRILSLVGQTRPPMYDLVDQLYYLPSVAVESPEKYDGLKASNPARYETLDQAIATCQANFRAVSSHPELHAAWGETFQDKMTRLTDDILHPERETELKLSWYDVPRLQEKMDAAYKDGMWLGIQRVTQSYHYVDNQEFRLRQTILPDETTLHYFTVKTGEGITRHEVQRRLTPEEYELLRGAYQVGATLSKTRYEFLAHHDTATFGYRKWTADHYEGLDRWEVEVAVHDESEDELYPYYLARNKGTYSPSRYSARQLAML